MNKFKGFLTVIAFVWLWSCGFWAIARWFFTGEVAWMGTLVNAWALPVWMLLRYCRPYRYRGDRRETPAFAAVLVGLAIALLTDSERGMAIHLAIYNLFVVLIYLFHLSALSHPPMPQVDDRFPELTATGGEAWRVEVAAGEGAFRGLLLVFLRGSFCADSRRLLAELYDMQETLARQRVAPVLLSTETVDRWRRWWPGDALPPVIQLDGTAAGNHLFVAAAGTPLWARAGRPRAACRPSAWLADRNGYILWRHLPGNYRLPGDAELLRSQLFRLDDDE